jgi:hypothetical protein
MAKVGEAVLPLSTWGDLVGASGNGKLVFGAVGIVTGFDNGICVETGEFSMEGLDVNISLDGAVEVVIIGENDDFGVFVVTGAIDESGCETGNSSGDVGTKGTVGNPLADAGEEVDHTGVELTETGCIVVDEGEPVNVTGG